MQNLKLDGKISEVVQMILAVVIGQRLGEKKTCPPTVNGRSTFSDTSNGLRTYPYE